MQIGLSLNHGELLICNLIRLIFYKKDAHCYVLDAANIQGAKKVILLGEDLQLAQEISFNTECIGKLLIPSSGNKVRPFSHQR